MAAVSESERIAVGLSLRHRWQWKREHLVCGLLLLAVAVVYGQTLRHDFVLLDDGVFVYENPQVLAGLTAGGLRWAMTSGTYGEWTPLASLSHMLDCQLWGPSPGPQHAVNVLLHAASSVILFLALMRMTRDFWPSAWVAAVFAVHPLHVESVAWVAERRDVLSGLFFMLVLWAYARYVELPSPARYLAVAGFFALGLMSKPIVVTTPLVLLLLDYWPLGRFAEGAAAARRLVWEKLPLLLMSAATCWIVLVTHGSRQVEARYVRRAVSTRLLDAIGAYGDYLVSSFWPTGLYPFYPNASGGPPPVSVAIGLIAFLLTAIAWFRLRRTSPYLAIGSFWFFGMLVPVIGLLQLGDASHADRYTYLGQIGLVIAVAWGIGNGKWWPDLLPKLAGRRWVLLAAAWAPVLVLLVLGFRQTSFWRNDESLWSHAISCDTDNLLPRFELCRAHLRAGKTPLAIRELREAAKIRSYDVLMMSETQTLLGRALTEQGKPDEGLLHYQLAVDIDPTNDIACGNLARALDSAGKHRAGDRRLARDAAVDSVGACPQYGRCDRGARLGHACRSGSIAAGQRRGGRGDYRVRMGFEQAAPAARRGDPAGRGAARRGTCRRSDPAIPTGVVGRAVERGRPRSPGGGLVPVRPAGRCLAPPGTSDRAGRRFGGNPASSVVASHKLRSRGPRRCQSSRTGQSVDCARRLGSAPPTHSARHWPRRAISTRRPRRPSGLTNWR